VRQPDVVTVPSPVPGSPVEVTEARLKQLGLTIDELNGLGLPVGWPDHSGPKGFSWWLLKAMGLLLTAGAASLGAPFWFDVLNRFMSVRSTGKAPEEAPKSPKQIPFPAPPGRPEGAPPPKEEGSPK